MNGLQKHLLVYDAGCGPCTKFRRSIEFLDSYGRLDYASLIEADSEGLLRDVPGRLRYRSFHLLSPEGKALSGAEAIPKLAALLPAGRLLSKLMTSAPGALWAIAFVYAVLSRLHDAGSCRHEGTRAESNESAREPEHQFGFLR